MNLWDILLLAGLAVAVILALRGLVLRRRQGKGCGGGCAGCTLDCERRTEKED